MDQILKVPGVGTLTLKSRFGATTSLDDIGRRKDDFYEEGVLLGSVTIVRDRKKYESGGCCHIANRLMNDGYGEFYYGGDTDQSASGAYRKAVAWVTGAKKPFRR